MDNLPKNQQPQNGSNPTTGDIFSNQTDSGYAAATQLIDENTPQEIPFAQDVPLSSEQVTPESFGQVDNQSDSNQSNGSSASPPFVEDNRKKFIGIAFIVVIILIIIFGSLAFIFSRAKKPPAPAQITLTYWGLWEDNTVIRSVIDEYQKQNSNITIVYQKQDQKQYRERLQAAIDRGEGPDIFRFHNTWLPMFIQRLAPVPKNVISDADYKVKYYPVVTSDLKAGENFFGIPLMIDGLLLYYNEDILKSANITVPATWVDMQNLAPKLTVKEKDKIVTSAVALGTAENIEHFSEILTLMMVQNGTKMDQGLFTCISGTNCAVEALSFYRKFAETPNNSWDDTLENSILAFAGGKVAMIFAPSWEAFTIKQLNPNLNFKTASVPQLPCDKQPCPSINLASYWVEGVSVKSKSQDAAFAFLKYLATPVVAQKLYAEQAKTRLFGEPYALVELGNLLSDSPYISALMTEAPTMKSFFSISKTYDGDTGLNSSLVTYLKDAVNSLSHGNSPETAMQTADGGFKQVLSRFGLAPAQ
jgi:multiple sugar transport system substrate-binding protein